MGKESRNYHRGNVRGDMIKVAERILKKEGLGELSLRRVAREIGVAPSAAYNHFENREALLAAIAARGFQRLFKLQKEAYEAEGDFEHGLRLAGSQYVKFACKHPNLYRLMFSFAASGQHNFPELYEVAARTFGLSVGLWYPDKDFRPDDSSRKYPEALTIWTTVHGLAHLIIDRQVTLENYKDDTIGELVDEVMDILMGGARSRFPSQ